MADDPHIPILIVGCTNTYQDPKRIAHLQAEREQVAAALTEGPTAKTVISAAPDAGGYFFDHIRRYQHQPDVALLHLSGYAAGRYFHFDGGSGEESLTAGQLATLIGRLPGLQAVWLSGCATTELLERLLLLDIPAVIVASVEGRDRDQLQGITGFYAALAAGASLRDAFAQLQAQSPAGRWQWHTATYDLEHDHLDWPGRDPEAPTPAWGLYTLAHHRAQLDWALPVQPVPAGAAAAARAERRTRRSRRIGSAILATLFLVVMLLLLWQHPRFQAWLQSTLDTAQAPCDFPPSSAYRILQFPLARAEACQRSDPYYDEGITRQLWALDPAGYQVCRPALPPCRVAASLAERLMAESHAQLVLWGTYDFPGRGQVRLRLHYRYAGRAHTALPGFMELEVPAPYFDREPMPQAGVAQVVHWAQAQGHWERQEYAAVLAQLDRLIPHSDSLRQEALLLRARSHLRLNEPVAALVAFDSLLRLSPDHATAYHERGIAQVRGRRFREAFADLDRAIALAPEAVAARYDRALLHLKFGRLDAAQADAQAVLQQAHDHGDAYGIIAAVHAARREKASLLVQLETALRYGLQAEPFISVLPAFAPFREDPDLQALLKRYP